MEEDILFKQRQLACAHEKQQSYRQKEFDSLNGFEFNFTRCLSCHKIVGLEAKKLT
jgi:hypothetical protein